MGTAATSAPVTSKRREATRERLMSAAFEVFVARGFGAASIEEVAAAAGFTRGAFYSNFASLEELFFALYERRAAVAAEGVSRALSAASSGSAGATSLGTLLETVVDSLVVERDWAMLKTDFTLHVARHPHLAQALERHRESVRASLAARLEPWLTTSAPDGHLDVRSALPEPFREPRDLARAVIAVHDAALLELVADPGRDLRAWLRDLLGALLDHSGPTTQQP